MKKRYLLTPLLLTAMLSVQATASDIAASKEKTTSKPLILAIDTPSITIKRGRTDTYTSQYGHSDLVEVSEDSKLDSITKTFKNVSRAFKRITSMRYGKGKKVRAKLGKTSLTLRYTHKL